MEDYGGLGQVLTIFSRGVRFVGLDGKGLALKETLRETRVTRGIDTMDGHEQRRLSIPDEIGRLMEQRGIREEDVRNTINHAEETGEKFVNSAGRSLASFRPDRVTYWVEYSLVGEEYRVHTAYSHRMEMKRKGRP